MKYKNFNLAKELSERSEKDWVFGATSQPALISIPESLRDVFLPSGEVQTLNNEDTQGCASRSPINSLAAQFTYGYHKKLFHPDNIKWLYQNGFVVNDTIDFSDNFIEILSGTNRQGNSLRAPIDAIRKNGLIPKAMLPLDRSLTWDEYMNPKRITQKMRDLGAEFARRFKINYELVNEIHMGEALKDDMLCVAAFAWPVPVNGEYPRVDAPPNHAFLVYRTPKYLAFDNYQDAVDGDFVKVLAPNYDFYDTIYRVFISSEDPNATEKQLTLMYQVLALLQRLYALLVNKTNTVETNLENVFPRPAYEEDPRELPMNQPPHKSKIQEWALAIQHAEGGKPQDLNTRNKNPGNLKYTKLTASLGGKLGGTATDGGSFCYFDTYEKGFDALCQFLVLAATDQLISYKSTDTLDRFTTVYACPPGKGYVNSVAARLSVEPSITIKELL